jgi:cell division protein FtsA
MICVPSGVTEVERKAVIDAANHAGARKVYLIEEPIAAAIGAGIDITKPYGTMILDIGGGTTDLIIIQDNVVRHAAVIPFGGNSITEDLKHGCGVSSKVAEQLKTLHGSCMSSIAPDKNVRINGIGGREDKQISLRNIAEIIESRVEEILEAAMYEIERSGYLNLINSGIVITGGTSQLANLQQFARLVTGMEIRLAVPSRQYAEIEVPINKPALSTAVGLVVLGFEKMEKEGTKYTSTTPINYKEEQKAAAAEKTAKEEPEPQTKKAQETKKREGWGLGNFFKQFKEDNMFTDNDA